MHLRRRQPERAAPGTAQQRRGSAGNLRCAGTPVCPDHTHTGVATHSHAQHPPLPDASPSPTLTHQVRSGGVDVLVVDSVAALVPRAELEGEMGDHHIALQARLMSQVRWRVAGHCSSVRSDRGRSRRAGLPHACAYTCCFVSLGYWPGPAQAHIVAVKVQHAHHLHQPGVLWWRGGRVRVATGCPRTCAFGFRAHPRSAARWASCLAAQRSPPVATRSSTTRQVRGRAVQ